ncbi:hypothetical protein M5689_007062 [Euphorbia peplus]|nr:hypothetical protein M5689_007062 [Euphorbia peplus]
MSSELNIAVISATLEPHGTVRSTRRARIVGVALELYFSKIASIPLDSKIDFCEFCELWAEQKGDMYKDDDEKTIVFKNDSEEQKLVVTKIDDEHSIVKKDDNKNIVVKNEDYEPSSVAKEEKGKVNEDGENDVIEGKREVVERKEDKEGRIYLPWELMQPLMRILSHCLMGPHKDEKLIEAARSACKSLYARSLHDINAKAILATRSLLRLSKLAKVKNEDEIDYTEIQFSSVIHV